MTAPSERTIATTTGDSHGTQRNHNRWPKRNRPPQPGETGGRSATTGSKNDTGATFRLDHGSSERNDKPGQDHRKPRGSGRPDTGTTTGKPPDRRRGRGTNTQTTSSTTGTNSTGATGRLAGPTHMTTDGVRQAAARWDRPTAPTSGRRRQQCFQHRRPPNRGCLVMLFDGEEDPRTVREGKRLRVTGWISGHEHRASAISPSFCRHEIR